MNNKMLLAAISQDLYRVALGYNKGAIKMAKIFSSQVIKRLPEVNTTEVKPYIKKVLYKLPDVLKDTKHDRLADDVLVYSLLLQNYALRL